MLLVDAQVFLRARVRRDLRRHGQYLKPRALQRVAHGSRRALGLLIEVKLAPKVKTERMMHIMFENFKVPAMYVQVVLSLDGVA